MKLLSTTQIKEADAFTIAHEHIASIDLMERAANAFVEKFLQLFDVYQLPIAVVAGTGNNGGDGLAIARKLKHLSAKPSVFIIGEKEKATNDFKLNLERLSSFSVPTIWIEKSEQLNAVSECKIMIDALFGIGLSRKVDGIYLEAIEAINRFKKTVVSVDVPSGLFCDKLNETNDAIVSATHTITFQQPKLSFLFPEGGKYCGNVHVVNIGLSETFYTHVDCSNFLTEKKDITDLKIFHRSKFTHKGTVGHLLLAAGSLGKAGAAVLSAKAALKSGVGLLTVHTCKANVHILQNSAHEAMCMADEEVNFISKIDADFVTAFAIGPGIGTHQKTAEALLNFLKQNKKPLVLDADAINILAQQTSLENLFPEQCVITPHPKEMERLVGISASSLERLEKAKSFTKKHNVVVVLKGAHTAIINPSGKTFFNTTGNAGMATAGSGDVLTGMVGSFLAQGLNAFDAAIAAVYLHGLAGDFAAKQQTQMCLTATDLINFLPQAVTAIR